MVEIKPESLTVLDAGYSDDEVKQIVYEGFQMFRKEKGKVDRIVVKHDYVWRIFKRCFPENCREERFPVYLTYGYIYTMKNIPIVQNQDESFVGLFRFEGCIITDKISVYYAPKTRFKIV